MQSGLSTTTMQHVLTLHRWVAVQALLHAHPVAAWPQPGQLRLTMQRTLLCPAALVATWPSSRTPSLVSPGICSVSAAVLSVWSLLWQTQGQSTLQDGTLCMIMHLQLPCITAQPAAGLWAVAATWSCSMAGAVSLVQVAARMGQHTQPRVPLRSGCPHMTPGARRMR